MSVGSLKTVDNQTVSNKFNDAAYADQIVQMRNVQLSYVRQGVPGEVLASKETVQANQVVVCESSDSSNEGYTYCMDEGEFNATSVEWWSSVANNLSQSDWDTIDKQLADPAYQVNLPTSGYTPCLVECDKRAVLFDPDGPYELEAPSAWGGDHENMEVAQLETLTKPDGSQVQGYPIRQCRDGCFAAEPDFNRLTL